jgi:hypothetical protein
VVEGKSARWLERAFAADVTAFVIGPDCENQVDEKIMKKPKNNAVKSLTPRHPVGVGPNVHW